MLQDGETASAYVRVSGVFLAAEIESLKPSPLFVEEYLVRTRDGRYFHAPIAELGKLIPW